MSKFALLFGTLAGITLFTCPILIAIEPFQIDNGPTPIGGKQSGDPDLHPVASRLGPPSILSKALRPSTIWPVARGETDFTPLGLRGSYTSVRSRSRFARESSDAVTNRIRQIRTDTVEFTIRIRYAGIEPID